MGSEKNKYKEKTNNLPKVTDTHFFHMVVLSTTDHGK